MKSLLIIILSVALSSCATMKNIARTLEDAADIACVIFGADHPEQFETLVRQVLPPAAPGLVGAEKSGFNPKVLCDLKEVLQPFIDDQLRLQRNAAARLSWN